MPLKPVFPRLPFLSAPFAYLPYGAVTLTGGVKTQLEALKPKMEALPLTGQALEALMPAAYLLGDVSLQARCHKALSQYIDAQAPDGYFKAESPADTLGVLKAMMAWYSAQRPEEALAFILKFSRYESDCWEELRGQGEWMALAGENMAVLSWLYHVTGSQPLLRLIDRVRLDALDWTSYFHTFPAIKPVERAIPLGELRQGLEDENGDIGGHYTRQHYLSHGLYVAMGLKTPALFAQLSGNIKEKDASAIGYQKLMRYHGVAAGGFNSEPYLAGGNPSGTMDTAAMGELAQSLASICVLKENLGLADSLECLAYNALASACRAGKVKPSQAVNVINTHDDAPLAAQHTSKALIGVVKGLCAYAATLCLALKDGGLTLWGYEPCQVKWRVKDTLVKLTIQGPYPQPGSISIQVQPKEAVRFALKLRVPAWCEDASAFVNDHMDKAAKQGGYLVFDRVWQPGDRVSLDLPMAYRETRWFHQSLAVMQGPLLMCLPIQEGQWRYGLRLPLGQPVEGALIPDWQQVNGVPGPPPIDPDIEGPWVPLPLVPYATPPQRISQFPAIREEA